MKPHEFEVRQKVIGATDAELAEALGTKPYVIACFKTGEFKIGGPSALCIRMLADMDEGMRHFYINFRPKTIEE